jgi:broad specificity polyphosphatase/5'/3'-nucleotidase SurE
MQAYIARYLKREVRAHRTSQKQFTRKCKQYMHQQNYNINIKKLRFTKHNTIKITKIWAIHVNSHTHTHTRTHTHTLCMTHFRAEFVTSPANGKDVFLGRF